MTSTAVVHPPWWPESWGDKPPRCPVSIDPKTRERRAWPIAPIIEHLVAKHGAFDLHENPDGYCSAKVEMLVGIHRTSWQRYVKRGYLTARQADLVACKLGLLPFRVWPEYGQAIEPDNAFLSDWDAEGAPDRLLAARLDAARRGILVVA